MIERNYDNIPEELKKLKQWVCWKAEKVVKPDGTEKYEKRLVNPYTGKWAKVNEPRDWAFFSIAKKTMEKYNYDGLSICLTDIKGEYIRNDIFCIDLDKVLLVPQTTSFKVFEASKIYDMFKGKTYIEYSMSGSGLHILGIGNLEENCRYRKNEVEMYDSKRFMSLTGVGTPDSTEVLGNLENELREANLKYVGKVEPVQDKVRRGDLTESDAELIAKIRKSRQAQLFSDYFDRGIGNGDHSSQDFSFCIMLAFWTRNNPAQMDSIFRQSALMRPKWDRMHGSQTYGNKTINNAIAKNGATREENYGQKNRNKKS